MNAAFGFAMGASAIGGTIGLGFGAKLLGGLVAIAGLPAAGLALVAGLGTFAGYRMSYRSAVGRAREEMGRALDAVAASIRSQSLFGTTASPRWPALPHKVSDDGTIISTIVR